jgi:hypothetical protein
LIEDLRADPFERAEYEANGYGAYIVLTVPAQPLVATHLQNYLESPPRQKPDSFSLDQVLRKPQEAGDSGKHRGLT